MKDTELELAGLPDDALVGDENEVVAVPVVAVVGRPNVGKSTLVNRIIGRRQAVVEDVPGVTRDRVAYDANWIGREFTVVDTGGWEPDAKDRAAAIARQAEAAIATADVVLFVVDAMVGATDDDEKAVKMLRRSKKPVLLVMGGKSHEVSPVWQQRQDMLTTWMSHAEPFVLDGATHMLHLENARGLAERLGAFFD